MEKLRETLLERKEKQIFKCDGLCIHFFNKECDTSREDRLCDQPLHYKEIGAPIRACR